MPARRTGTPVADPVTLAEAKAHLRVDFDDANDEIGRLIRVATLAAENRTERTLVTTSWVLPVPQIAAGLCIQLSNPPVIAVDRVEYIDQQGQPQAMLAGQHFVLDRYSEPARLWWTGDAVLLTAKRLPVTIHYTAGYGPDPLDVPAPIRHWILLAVGDLWVNRTRSAEKPAVPQGFADGLLDPYRMWGC